MRTGNMGKLLSLDARGRFGYSGGFGRIAFGYTRLGFYNWFCGTYQKKYYYGKPFIARQRITWGYNPQTEKQQSWRAVCAYAWVLWALVDVEIRELWKKKGNLKHITGPNLFMSRWLSMSSGGFGNIYFSYNNFGRIYQFDKNY